MADNQVDLKLNLDFKGVNDALYQMIGQFNGTDKEFQKIAKNIEDNAKKLEASIKLFGPASQQAANAQKALERNMTSLVANGVKPEIAAIATLQQGFNSLNNTSAVTETTNNKLKNSFNNSESSLKKSNKQYSALALVLQDLPYGFRGIQNNLPALFGSIATGTGIAYVGFSALIAVITALDMGIIKFGNSVKLNTDYAKEAANTYATETIELDSLYRVSQDVNVSMSDRLTAAQSLIKEYPGLLGSYSAEDIALGKAIESYDKLRESVWAYAKVKAAEKVLIELGAKQNELTIKQNKITTQQNKADIKGLTAVNYAMYNNISLTEQFYKFVNDLPVNGAFGPIVNALPEMQKTTDLLNDIKKEQKDLNDETKLYQDIIDGNIVFAKLFKEVQKTKPQQKLKKEEKPVVSKVYENLAQEEFNFYKDSIFRAEEYFIKLNDIQRINALMEATIKGASADELFAIQQTYDQKALNFQKEHQSRVFDVLHQGQQVNKKLTDDFNKEKLDGQVNYTKDYIKSLDAQLSAELKLHKNNVALQQEDVKNKIIQLQFAQVFAAGNVTALEAINAAILKLKGNLTGLGDVSTTVSSILSTSLQDTFVGIGESLGELVTTGKFNFGILGTILADALIGIGKALILYSSLVQAAKKAIESGQVKAGLIIGIAAVAAGFALKGAMNKKKNGGAKEFANGGIISGPTMGLMGEYPGASRNPEVVAPLDKLKSLIGGGGGGTLEARISGNDLLILMNKAGRNNNNTF